MEEVFKADLCLRKRGFSEISESGGPKQFISKELGSGKRKDAQAPNSWCSGSSPAAFARLGWGETCITS